MPETLNRQKASTKERLNPLLTNTIFPCRIDVIFRTFQKTRRTLKLKNAKAILLSNLLDMSMLSLMDLLSINPFIRCIDSYIVNTYIW